MQDEITPANANARSKPPSAPTPEGAANETFDDMLFKIADMIAFAKTEMEKYNTMRDLTRSRFWPNGILDGKTATRWRELFVMALELEQDIVWDAAEKLKDLKDFVDEARKTEHGQTPGQARA